MNKVIIFGGTTEGKELAIELAKAKIPSLYLVATDYGKKVIDDDPLVDVHIGRLGSSQMKELFEKVKPIAIVDSTHPYAELVKKEIDDARKDFPDIRFFRVHREGEKIDACGAKLFENAGDCAKALLETKGTIFLTTGSKDIPEFCREKSLCSRLVARVIPNGESLKICYDNGLLGKQIIAMQGPFSYDMNLTFFKNYDAKVVVLKESGKVGGELERIQAAKDAGAQIFIIKRPIEAAGEDYERVKNEIISISKREKTASDMQNEKTGTEHTKSLQVILAGFGMGKGSLTLEVKRAIDEADYIFGAERMLKGITSECRKYPYYLASDIIPALEKIKEENAKETIKAVVLFSGDTGFYSGAGKLNAALIAKGYSPKVLPGISSVSALCARIGENWQDKAIISTHGVDEKKWIGELIASVTGSAGTIAITSGVKDINRIGKLLEKLENDKKGKFTVYAGCNLYSEEKICVLDPAGCMELNEEGLYTLIIKNEQKAEKELLPGLKDDEFIRDKVPMTKEEIRTLSICKLKVCDRDVIYDIGGGTGSVSVECARLSPGIKVYSVEKRKEACDLIRKNAEKFMLSNIEVVEGTAPEALNDLPAPDKVFIGGSSGNLREIFEKLRSFEKKIRVVANAVTIETIAALNELIKDYDIKDADIALVQVSKAKSLGQYSLMEAENPVYIVSFTIGY
ncbi:precorrin-6Y C5,15-methyltransferase (decarboxylating) [Butyrivibrio sp. Su6]|uniref:precorrin-6A reductase n=1 Tax=Butyrivibrio sp. Su6 TaxID=1520810 RepID=UPI00089F1D03|nr:precorrin-6A reductase [Butyrivibrio sp. Su6]SEG10106.1 precorrin-6Y C5,15-methyltransferase (decarboxylating) [Butyrivibrio sp. Su6]